MLFSVEALRIGELIVINFPMILWERSLMVGMERGGRYQR